MNDSSNKPPMEVDHAAGIEGELRGLRDVFERIYSLLWWSAIIVFSAAFTLSVWAITQNLVSAIVFDLILVATYGAIRFLKWLFAGITLGKLQSEIDFPRSAASAENNLDAMPASTSPAGT